MNNEITKDLWDKFPLLYRGRKLPITQCLMAFGFEHGDGWKQIIYDLSEKLENIIRQMPDEEQQYYYAVQIKEKFGTLRFYMSCETPEMEKLIAEAEKLTSITCEICGKPGEERNNKGWYTTLCEEHNK